MCQDMPRCAKIEQTDFLFVQLFGPSIIHLSLPCHWQSAARHLDIQRALRIRETQRVRAAFVGGIELVRVDGSGPRRLYVTGSC